MDFWTESCSMQLFETLWGRIKQSLVFICDVICEKGAYGGTNSVFLNQLFLQVWVVFYSLHCTHSEKNIFSIRLCVTKSTGFDQTPRRTRGV